jgi:hypothetical protein
LCAGRALGSSRDSSFLFQPSSARSTLVCAIAAVHEFFEVFLQCLICIRLGLGILFPLFLPSALQHPQDKYFYGRFSFDV